MITSDGLIVRTSQDVHRDYLVNKNIKKLHLLKSRRWSDRIIATDTCVRRFRKPSYDPSKNLPLKPSYEIRFEKPWYLLPSENPSPCSVLDPFKRFNLSTSYGYHAFYVCSSTLDRVNRGSISSFSRHSALRLREYLAFATLKNTSFGNSPPVFGVCLTVPWKISRSDISGGSISPALALRAYKRVWNRFQVSFRRAFPHSGCVFRHELQKRKAPHSHLVFYASNLDFGSSISTRLLSQMIFGLWVQALGYDVYSFRSSGEINRLKTFNPECLQYQSGFMLFGGSLNHFRKYGVKVDLLSSDHLAMFRYLADHSSKHKQSQLGYSGKQWGVLNRKVFWNRGIRSFDFSSDRQRISFFRQLDRCSRFVVSSIQPKLEKPLFRRSGDSFELFRSPSFELPCVFHRKLSSRCTGRGLVFVDGRTSSKLFSFLS